jgi:hypothetical protein
LDNKSINISPNPTSKTLNVNIQNHVGVINVQIVNSVGQIVKSQSNREDNFQIDLSSITSGIYYLKLSDGKNGLINKKIIIK